MRVSHFTLAIPYQPSAISPGQPIRRTDAGGVVVKVILETWLDHRPTLRAAVRL